MNYEESLARLEAEKKRLEDKSKTTDLFGEEKFIWNEGDKEKWELIKELIKAYSKSLAGEVDIDKVDQTFSKLYGFTKQKEEIKSLLLTQKYFKAKGIKANEKGKILCFVGSPGVGKTYFARKFAKALGRGFFSINLGGAGSAVIITGGKGIWRGSEPGGIINAVLKTESCDPVILLDEVEKTGDNPYHGTITNALLHILDPEQNQRFIDQFLNIEIDISRITFILTANEIEKISEPLKNRLEIIKLKDYDESEKISIGKMDIERIFQEDYGNNNKDLFEMSESALYTLISKIKEPGVRQLESKIRSIIHWCFTQWAQQLEKGEEEEKIIIDENKVNELFPEEEEKKEEDSEEEKLRKKNEELEQENEDLKKKTALNLFKPLTISEDKKHCHKHQKDTLQTSEEACFLCELEEQVKQLEATIQKENWETCEKIWEGWKSELLKQSDKLQNGTEEEKEIAQKIKSSIARIQKKFQQISNSQSNQGSTNLPWIIGGGIILTLIGCFVGWLLVKKVRKGKNIIKHRDNEEK